MKVKFATENCNDAPRRSSIEPMQDQILAGKSCSALVVALTLSFIIVKAGSCELGCRRPKTKKEITKRKKEKKNAAEKLKTRIKSLKKKISTSAHAKSVDRSIGSLGCWLQFEWSNICLATGLPDGYHQRRLLPVATSYFLAFGVWIHSSVTFGKIIDDSSTVPLPS